MVRNPRLARRASVWLAGLLCAAPAGALSSLRFAIVGETGSAALVAGGRTLLRLRHERAEEAARLAAPIAARLADLAEQGVGPEAFAVVTIDPGARAIEAGGQRLCLITPEAARRTGSAPAALAADWLANLQAAFDGPYLSLPGSGAQVPLGEEIGLPVRGRPANGLSLTAPDDGIVRAKLTDGNGLRLYGAALGSTTVTLRRGEATLDLPVAVRKRAGRVRLPVETTITGTGTDADTVRAAVASALFAAVELEPEATFDYNLPGSLPATTPGGSQTVPVAVTLDGLGYLEQRQIVPVTLRGAPWSDQPADRLLVSNVPESVAHAQLLLRAVLPADRRTRLLYHHKTIAASALTYEVRLLNPGPEPASVHVRDANAGPSPDEILVGHLACRKFWQECLAQQGAVVQVPPGGAWTLVSAATPPRQVFSGLSELTTIAGEGVEVQVVATANRPYRGPSRIQGEPRAPLSDEFTLDSPVKTVVGGYRPGGMWAFLNVGREPLASLTGKPLAGNFGVTYLIELTFENPEPAPTRFELVFSADGGVARGVVIVDGQLYETGLVRPTHQERLLEFTLPPGGRRTLRLRILPQSGSNYPLRLVGRPFQRDWPGRGPGP